MGLHCNKDHVDVASANHRVYLSSSSHREISGAGYANVRANPLTLGDTHSPHHAVSAFLGNNDSPPNSHTSPIGIVCLDSGNNKHSKFGIELCSAHIGADWEKLAHSGSCESSSVPHVVPPFINCIEPCSVLDEDSIEPCSAHPTHNTFTYIPLSTKCFEPCSAHNGDDSIELCSANTNDDVRDANCIPTNNIFTYIPSSTPPIFGSFPSGGPTVVEDSLHVSTSSFGVLSSTKVLPLDLHGSTHVKNGCNDAQVCTSSNEPCSSSCAFSASLSDLSSHNELFLDICTIVDNLNISTHLSPGLNIFHHMSSAYFQAKVVPTLNKMCNHKCDRVSLNSATWNTHGLLGSNTLNYSHVHKVKEDGSRRLLISNHIVGMIELHADMLECDTFTKKWSHSHVFFWSISDDRNCGGACIAISKSYLSTCLLCFAITIVPSRIIGVLLIFPNVNLFFVCIHNSPTWNALERYLYFKRIQNCVPSCLHVTTILCGDLNFGHNTIRFNNLQPDSSIVNAHKALACLWETFFHEFIEIAHDCPTFMRGTYLSQLDHVWTNILPAILLDLTPSAAVSWQFGDHLGNASDHTPVHLSIGADSGTRVSSVPRWVPKHPDFKANCIKLSEQVLILPGSPFEILQRQKAILKEAARLTVLHACRLNTPLDIDQKIYWSMILLRHRHELSNRQVVNATKSYKTLSQFLIRIDNGSILDIRALSLHIDELQYTKATGDIASLPADSLDSDAKRIKLNRLGQCLTLWASRRRKITNLVIVGDSGDVSDSAPSAANILGTFWQPRFLEQKVYLNLARIAIREHIQKYNGSQSHIISFDAFCERIFVLRDSGVGCDSLLYSCWIFCHEDARLALYKFYLHLHDFDLKPEEEVFLDSRLVFIQKGRIDADQSGNCRRHPKKTRPLNLGNTDCKIISCMISLILSSVCNSCITTLQAGGMRGKQMIDLIFTLEAKVFDYIVRNLPNSGIFALDIASAFPSLSRKYLFWVLRQMNLCKPFRRLVMNLHRKSKGTICFRNLLFAALTISTGVKQGDPSAMQLFILGYDPLIKFISASLSPIEHILLPYCDDLAIAIANVVNGWQRLLKCFGLIYKISSLLLNTDKTQFLLTSQTTKDQDICAIMNLDSCVSHEQFQNAIKYLGIFIGPDSLDENWSIVLNDYLSTSRFIASLDCGLLTKISLYNMLAIAKLSYIASFLPPNPAILKAENRALQTLCRGPWNAIPPSLLKAVKQIGMPSQATDLTFLSIASKVRVAHLTSQNIFVKSDEIDRFYDGFDIVLQYLNFKLSNSTTIKIICNTYKDFLQKNSAFDTRTLSQKKVFQRLIEKQETPFCFRAFISLKTKRILKSTISPNTISSIINAYVFGSSKSFALTFTHIRTISNHWCTRARFGAKSVGCVFSCGHDNDNIRHSCSCPKFWTAFFSIAKITPFPISLETIISFSNDSIAIPDSHLHTILIGLHISFLCFNSCRHGKAFNDRLVQHHLSHFLRQHAKVSPLFRSLQLGT